MATVFLNGRFLSREEASVSAFDAGFQHGVGLFETMTAVVGQAPHAIGGQRAREEAEVAALGRVRVVHLPEHMQRLAASARALGLSDALRTAALEEAVSRTVARASMELPDQAHFRVRLTITGGDLNMLTRGAGAATPQAQQPTVLIVAQPATPYPREMFERGVGVSVADYKANPLNPFEGHKTLAYWPRLRELQVAATKGAAESLVFQVSNHLSGGCVSNAFLVKNGVLVTPLALGDEGASDIDQAIEHAMGDAGGAGARRAQPAAADGREGRKLPSPVLPGITRRWVMDWADSELVDVERRMVTIADVLDADEVLLTNSSWGVLPVVRVEREAIGDAVVGEVGRRLVQAWAELVAT
ncbi:MAG: aminotransferase class IV [Phycisphaerales bacterium]